MIFAPSATYSGDDAAQKRVSRAVEWLRELFAKRGVAVGAGGLAVGISAHAVQAAPIGLAMSITTAVTMAGTTIATTAAIATAKTIAMTALQKTAVATVIVALTGIGIYEARQAARWREHHHQLQQQHVRQVQQLQSAHDDATNRLAMLNESYERLNNSSAELLKLRAQVNSLLQRTQELNLTAKTATNSETKVSINEAEYVVPESWEHAGQDSPTAAIRTALWAMTHGDATKLMEVLWFSDNVQETLTAPTTLVTLATIEGARIAESKQIGHDNDECLFMVKLLEESAATTQSGAPAGRIKSISEPRPFVVRRFGDIWRVVPNGGRVLTPEEIARSHTEAVAK